jgi:hypothetical protein
MSGEQNNPRDNMDIGQYSNIDFIVHTGFAEVQN